MKKRICITLALLGALNLYAQEENVSWQKDITMIVVPRETLAVQVAQDISRRYPVLLVCYQRTATAPALHAWDGESWVSVSTNDYVNGTFFTYRPRHTVLVEETENPAPDILIPNETWCDKGHRLSSTDPAVMIHLLGRYFDFPYRYWMQFSKRYKYELEEINPALINVPFVHYRGDQVLPAFKARDYDRNMDKWSKLDIIEPEPIESVELKEPKELPAGEILTQETVDEQADMPQEEIIDQPVDMPDEQVDTPDQSTETQTVKTVSETFIEIHNPQADIQIDPFSTNDIPTAEVIVTPTE